ncbi:DUF4374 domain-containing protein [Flavobacterium algicola]|uniref:DUF4374 domain-containing protein n=1 Tax=Flavobacterium algicola TaxID=556529 RepID=UPI001EFD5542|nr:DUF4374 domain-containing protein [Flavobacterium algicola]MCG9792806.1 DUF4374 domain-containing protein [Flavobacterium algicola]
MKKTILACSLFLALGTTMNSCSSNDDGTTPVTTTDSYKYLLSLSLPTVDSYPFHTLTNIKEGTAAISNSQEIANIPYNVPVTGKDGFVYLNSESKLTKYKVNDNGLLVAEGSVGNLGISGGPVFEFLNNETLLLSSGPRGTTDGVFSYQIIDVTTMTEKSTGTIKVPVSANSTAYLSEYILKEGKIYVPYLHVDSKTFKAYDQAPVAIFNAATMTYEKTIYTKNAAALGYSVVSSYGFAENGDLYITACNTNYWGANETIDSGVVRIKAGESDFDASYFFNLTQKFNENHTGGFLYVGNNKGIVQVFRSDLISKYGDYQGAFVIEYYVVDIATKSTQKLTIPLSKYPRRAMSLLKDGTVAIVGNTEKEGNNLYIYDPKTNAVTVGLKYQGTEFIESFINFE